MLTHLIAFALRRLAAMSQQVVALVNEMQEVADFLLTRANTVGADPAGAASVRMNLANQMGQKVLNLRLFEAADAAALGRALATSGYGEDGVLLISNAIDGRLRAIGAEPAMKTSMNKLAPQLLTRPLVFFTRLDWMLFDDPTKSIDQKTDRIVHRFSKRLGVTHPHEQTYKRLAAMLVLAHFMGQAWPKYSHIFAIVNSLKEAFNAVRAPFPHGHIIQYPASPSDLPPVIQAFAYDSDDPPIIKDLDRFEQVAEYHVPLRTNSKLLTAEGYSPQAQGACNRGGIDALALLRQLGFNVPPNLRPQLGDDGGDARQHRPEINIYGKRRRSSPASSSMGAPNGSVDSMSDAPESPPTHQGQSAPLHMQSPPGAPSDIVVAPSQRSLFGPLVPRGSGAQFASPVFKGLPPRGRAFGNHPALGVRCGHSSGDDHTSHGHGDGPADDGAASRGVDAGGASDGDADAEPPSPPRRPRPTTAAAYEAAAVDALQRRDDRRAEERKAKKAEKAAEKAAQVAAKEESPTPMKAKRERGSVLMKKPSMAPLKHPASKCEKAEVPVKAERPCRRPPVPKKHGSSDPDPVLYNGGKVYTRFNKTMFRVIRTAKLYATEKQIRWAAPKPSVSEWSAALDLIDDSRRLGVHR